MTRISVTDISATDTYDSLIQATAYMARNAQTLSPEQRKLLPLTPAVFFVLFALADGEKHGYVVMQHVAMLSDGKFRMGPGTLYTTIQRLLELSLIEETANHDEPESRRRYYRLTGAGKALLHVEFDRMDALLRLAHQKKLVPRNAQ